MRNSKTNLSIIVLTLDFTIRYVYSYIYSFVYQVIPGELGTLTLRYLDLISQFLCYSQSFPENLMFDLHPAKIEEQGFGWAWHFIAKNS